MDVISAYPLRKRDDLIVERIKFTGGSAWIVKDPLALQYHHFREEEYAVLELLDGRRTLAEVRDQFEKRFAPRHVEAEDIARFAAKLHEQYLVVSEAPEQQDQRRRRRDTRRRSESLRRWADVLAWRFRGFDPQAFLDRCYPFVRPLLSRTATFIAAAVMIAAALLVAVRWSEFVARLPSHREFFTPATLPALSLTLAVVKVLHEFGHAFVCRHFGGRCHELGVMLLVFTPCLYCNVSDAWRFASKWRRIAVSAAGMYVELVLAALATFGWWYSTPGLFHYLCLNVMFICSVSTLFFNGNPLLRYDGYYILADLVNTPNFGTTSAAVFYRYASRLVCEPPLVDDPFLPRRHRFWYAAYHAASTMYRVVLLFSIAWFLIDLARPYRLENVVRLGLLGIFAAMIVQSGRRLITWLSSFPVRARRRTPRVVLTSAALAAVVAATFLIPLPRRATGVLEIVPQDGQRVFVDFGGRLVEQSAHAGNVVRSGDVIARLTNDALELQLHAATATLAELRGSLDDLVRAQFQSPAAKLREPEMRRRVESAENLLAEKRAEVARLTLRAGRDGTIFPGPADYTPTAAGELRRWSGCPDDPVNLGCTLPAGTLYCEIGDPSRWDALIAVDQADIAAVRVGLPVDIVCLQVPDVVLHGTVEEIAQGRWNAVPRQLSNKSGGDLATHTDATGREAPLTMLYQVRVALDDPQGLLRMGLRGAGKIHVDREPLAFQLGRWLARTFHFSF